MLGTLAPEVRTGDFEMPIFRSRGRPHAVPVSMAGIKMGDQVLQLGCRDPGMLAALALQVGLSGQACAVAETEEAAGRARKAAAKAGTLVDIQVAPFHDLPYADALFNLVILREVIASMRPYDRAACLQDVRRVLSGGGRCLIIEWAERGGLGVLFSKQSVDPVYWRSGGAERALQTEGFKPVRRLAERDGLAFIEGVRPWR